MAIPKTSVSLIVALQDDPRSSRWAEMYRRYERTMREFMQARYPTLEADDAIQETMAALARRMPGYRYLPDEKGHFSSYLLGILGHKAADMAAARAKEANALKKLHADPTARRSAAPERWKAAAVEVAIAQLMADDTINPLHRTVFRHVALNHEDPGSVAAHFGISRQNVDKIKSRLVSRLASAIRKMTAAEA